jgi:hypothetical protein
MTIQKDAQNATRLIGRCERCDLATPAMAVASAQAAGQIMTAAGWLVLDAGVSFCPRCRDIRLASDGGKRQSHENAAQTPGDSLPRVAGRDT